jgi:hypothetical protein
MESLRGDEVDRLGRLRLLASALSGRAVEVAPAEPGDPAWTDGQRIFVGAEASPREQLRALAVQASLLAAGSLAPDVVRKLRRRPSSARRYLAVEGHRALAANEPLLPRPLRSLIDREVAARGDSPAASLAAALGREMIADPPEHFGAIRARRLLEASGRVSRETRDRALIELEEDENEAGSVADHFSSPAGRGGALGRLLQRMLRAVRQLGADGPPGAATATHGLRAGTRSGPDAQLSVRAAGSLEEAATRGRGTKYPEWDVQRRRYRDDWCTVREVEPQPKDGALLPLPDGHGLRRALARLGTGLDSCHRQVEGDDIDIDAAVEARVDVLAGAAGEEAIYVDARRRRRDLAVLLLLDVSGSVAEPGATGGEVHEHQRAAAAALATALHRLGDRVALYAFHSQGRSAVHLVPVKRFDDGLDALVMRRLGCLVPGAYSRLGAAIRHGAAVLEARGGTSRRLLIVLSDGLAYDHGYEPAYGAADARRALAEARGRGIGCLCLTIGAGTDAEALRRVFGSVAHAAIPGPERLKRVIGPLFRASLRSAEVRRR